jgi:hypothetical protein
MNSLTTGFMGLLLGMMTTVALTQTMPSVFLTLPDRGSFEAKEMCNVLFKEKEPLTGSYVEDWVSVSVLERFERELEFLPEVARDEARSKAEPYIDLISSGKVSESSINNIAYIIEKAKPEPQG